MTFKIDQKSKRVRAGLCVMMLFSWTHVATADLRANHHPWIEGEFDPGMDGYEYRDLLDRQEVKGQLGFLKETSSLQSILAIGKRNLEWLDAVNSVRLPDQKLELSTADSQVGYPLTAPSESNEGLVLAAYAQLQAEIPSSMLQALEGPGVLPVTIPVDDATYLNFTRRIDKIYQRASRWLLQAPFLWQYTTYSMKDIRGYYFLSQETGLDPKLTGWTSLVQAERDRLSPLLIGQCRNQGHLPAQCAAELKQSIQQNGSAKVFFQKYLAIAKQTYDAFFILQSPRKDIQWTSADPDVLHMPFEDPNSPVVQGWLKGNIEDEWRVGNWSLRLAFHPANASQLTTHVVFSAGVTPHVDGLGGSEITMDANRNLQEYTSRWTIRHEFGHTLGFPDCYEEFYDEDREVMIQYQLDVDNLMCSRKGHLHRTHYDELKKAYFK